MMHLAASVNSQTFDDVRTLDRLCTWEGRYAPKTCSARGRPDPMRVPRRTYNKRDRRNKREEPPREEARERRSTRTATAYTAATRRRP